MFVFFSRKYVDNDKVNNSKILAQLSDLEESRASHKKVGRIMTDSTALHYLVWRNDLDNIKQYSAVNGANLEVR